MEVWYAVRVFLEDLRRGVHLGSFLYDPWTHCMGIRGCAGRGPPRPSIGGDAIGVLKLGCYARPVREREWRTGMAGEGRFLKLKLILSKEVTKSLVTNARFFSLSVKEVLSEAPGIVAGTLKTLAEIGGRVATATDTPDGCLTKFIEMPSLSEFRRSPGVKVSGSAVESLGGVHVDGAILELTLGAMLLGEVNMYVKADSVLEVTAYTIWAYLTLLNRARKIGGTLGVVDEAKNRFYFMSRHNGDAIGKGRAR
jgi:hypothetical protein